MWRSLKQHHSPSLIIVSTSSQFPRRLPSRLPSRTCGARLMLSIPPATAMPTSPDLTIWGAEDHGHHARGAHLVDCEGRRAVGDSAVYSGLSRRSLSQSRSEHVAHDRVLGAPGVQSGSFERPAYRGGAQLRGRDGRQTASKLSYRSPRGPDDYDILTSIHSVHALHAVHVTRVGCGRGLRWMLAPDVVDTSG